MQERLKLHLDQVFAGAPQTRRVQDLKQELYANLVDKYQDMLAQGKSEQESYEAAIRSIGDVSELLERAKEENENMESDASRRKTAKVVALCVGGYILALLMLIQLSALPVIEEIPVLVFLLIAGISTCVLIYHFISKPHYVKKGETVAEEFHTWSEQNKRSKEVYDTLSRVLWLCAVAIYIIVSFTFGGWSFTWVIFILTAAVQNIIGLFFNLPKKGE